MVGNTLLLAGGKLKREFTLPLLVAAMIGLNIGGSLFVLTAMAAGLTGSSIIIAQLLSALPIILALVPYLMLTSAMPVNCGNYQYAKLFSKPLAVAGWWGLFAAIPLGALPLFAIASAKLLIIVFPGLPITATAIVIMTFFFLTNILGIKATAYLQFGAVVLLVLALVVFIFGGLPAIDAQNFTPVFSGGLMGFIGAAALLYTLLAGGLFGIEMGAEVKDARTVIPKALIISIVVVLVLYILIEIIAVGVIPSSVLAEGGTLGTAAEAFLSPTMLAVFVIGGGILASTTTINLTLTASGRYVLASSEDKLFPRFFSSINQRFGTPQWGLTLAYVLSIISLLINPSLQTLATMLNFGLLFMVTLVLLAALRLPKKHPEIYESATHYKFGRKTVTVTSIIAIVINIIFMAVLAIAVPTAFFIFAGFIAFGLLFYLLRKRKVKQTLESSQV